MGMVVYRSSAGSGKTYTLVKEYLQLCMSSDQANRYQSIMAVTFTNKAANEMKSRVIKYLKELSDPNTVEAGELELQRSLCSYLQIDKDQLATRAQNTLSHILHHYADFNISTIDKFILKIIRSFAFDFQIPFNFDIELDTDTLLEQAVDAVVEQAGQNKELTNFLLQFVNEQAKEDGNWNVKFALQDVAKESIKDESQHYVEQLKDLSFQDFMHFKKACDDKIKAYQSKIENWAEQGKQLLLDHHLEGDYFHGKKRGSVHSYFTKFTSKQLTTKPSNQTQGYFEKESYAHPSCDPGITSTIESIQQELYRLYLNIEQLKDQEGPSYISYRAVSKQLFQLALINEIKKKFEALKTERNFIHISEFNQKVAEIVLEQPIPFIYERIGEKFKNYLIDEFQDTSELQWMNMLPLIENSLAYDDLNLIVGDVKQAIYRWRGGHADQFQNIDQVPEHANDIVKERSARIIDQMVKKPLNTNYRSSKDIIEFNNLFFRELLPQLKYNFTESYYSDYKQEVHKKDKSGFVEIALQEGKAEATHEEFINEECVQRIHDVMQRGYQYSDIAILARKNAELSNIGLALSKANIPILSSVSLCLAESPEITFLSNCLSAMLRPTEISHWLEMILYLDPKLADNHTFIKTLSDKKNLREKVIAWISEKGFEYPQLNNLGILEALESIVRAFKIDKNDPFVQKLLDIALQKNAERLGDFLEWWNDKKHKIYLSSPEGINAVQLMTVHKSKGLEFPIVIYAYANSSRSSSKSTIWSEIKQLDLALPSALLNVSSEMENSAFSEEYYQEKSKALLDDLNTFYVALTRAANELYLLGKEFTPKEPNNISSNSAFLYPVLSRLEEVDGSYQYGKKTQGKAFKKVETEEMIRFEASTKPWSEKIRLSYEAPLIWNVPQDSEESFIEADPRHMGELSHQLLSISENKEDMEEKLAYWLSEGIILKEQQAELLRTCSAVLEHPQIQEWWKLPVQLIEKEFISADGSILRPDRVILENERTLILDFKTGSKLKKHHKQIKQYASVLKEMGYPSIEAFLIYTDPVAIEQVH